MGQALAIIAAAVLVLSLHLAIHAASRKFGRGAGKGLGNLARPGLRKILTAHYQRKVIKQMQEERAKAGAPPLENPHLE